MKDQTTVNPALPGKDKSAKNPFPTRQVKPELVDKVISLVIALNRDTLRELAIY